MIALWFSNSFHFHVQYMLYFAYVPTQMQKNKVLQNSWNRGRGAITPLLPPSLFWLKKKHNLQEKTQFYVQLVFKAPLCTILRIKTLVVAYFDPK